MRLRSRTSRVVTPGVHWIPMWKKDADAPSQPPSSTVAVASDTGFPYCYEVASGGRDEFWLAFFDRVTSWILRNTEDGADPSTVQVPPDLTITAGGTAGPTDPFTLGLGAIYAGWTQTAETGPTIVGDRSAFREHENRIENEAMPTPPADDLGTFQYTHEKTWSFDGTSGVVTITFVLKMRGNELLQWGGTAFIPFEIYYRWHYTDDSGVSAGGFVTNYDQVDRAGFPLARMTAATFDFAWRYGQTEFGGGNHQGLFIAAYEFQTPKADQTTFPGQFTSTTSSTTSLEILGTPRPANVFIQPNEDTGGEAVYYPYEKSGSNLYDPDTGHLLVPLADFPLTM